MYFLVLNLHNTSTVKTEKAYGFQILHFRRVFSSDNMAVKGLRPRSLFCKGGFNRVSVAFRWIVFIAEILDERTFKFAGGVLQLHAGDVARSRQHEVETMPTGRGHSPGKTVRCRGL